ncbi:phage holin family protein [uncultured Akkermansia sp.]|uniref:phage holin family protein n=1 Tax=uncultured Akkermansia sp. TaxID=512294 RepID=UPI00265D3930|nr:phage holin family protein [uncultured Akkermansia sp.]
MRFDSAWRPSSSRAMGLIDKFKRTFVTPIVEEKEEGVAMARSLRETGEAALAHMEALCSLLKLELEEASQRLEKKMLLLLAGAFMAVFGYLFLWCLLTMVMAHFWGVIAGFAVTAGFHLLVAAAAFIMFSRIHVTPIAPATAEELKTDLSCLQMALKKSSHS